MEMMMPSGEILLRAVSSGETGGVYYTYSEIYRVDLESNSASRYQGSMLLMDDPLSSMVATDDAVYILGGDRHRDKVEDITLKELSSFHIHTGASAFHFLDPAPGWKPLPEFKSLESVITCASLNGNLFVFGGNVKQSDGTFTKSPGEVLSTRRKRGAGPRWLFLDPPPSQPDREIEVCLSHVSTPALVDTDNNRILVHLNHTESLFAYYPRTRKWDFLRPLRSWNPLTLLFNDMLIIRVKRKLVGFDLITRTTYNPINSNNFPTQLLELHFDAFFPLPTPATFCLAVSYPEGHNTDLTFVKFRLELSSSREPHITFISDHKFQLGCNAVVTDYLPAPPGNFAAGCMVSAERRASDEERRKFLEEPKPWYYRYIFEAGGKV